MEGGHEHHPAIPEAVLGFLGKVMGTRDIYICTPLPKSSSAHRPRKQELNEGFRRRSSQGDVLVCMALPERCPRLRGDDTHAILTPSFSRHLFLKRNIWLKSHLVRHNTASCIIQLLKRRKKSFTGTTGLTLNLC